LPKFGARKVGALTRSDVQAWIGELHAAKLSPATVHHHHVALKKALRHALDDRLISYNPCDGVRLPKAHNADGFKPVVLTAAQVENLADLLDFQRPYGLLVRFAAYTGLRAGLPACASATST